MKTSQMESYKKKFYAKAIGILSVLNINFLRHRGRIPIFKHFFCPLFPLVFCVFWKRKRHPNGYKCVYIPLSIVSKYVIYFLQRKQTELNVKYWANRNSFHFHNHVH